MKSRTKAIAKYNLETTKVQKALGKCNALCIKLRHKGVKSYRRYTDFGPGKIKIKLSDINPIDKAKEKELNSLFSALGLIHEWVVSNTLNNTPRTTSLVFFIPYNKESK
jgi:hypothetical protein